MPRNKKPSKICSFSLRSDLYDKLEQYANDYYMPKTLVVELALTAYFEQIEAMKKDGKSPVLIMGD